MCAILQYGTAHLSKTRCGQSIWGLNFGQTKHEIACRESEIIGEMQRNGATNIAVIEASGFQS